MPEPLGPLEAEFQGAVKEWRERHNLKEDDAVVLLIELFKIHQKHWDSIRSQDIPGRSELLGTLNGQLGAIAQGFHSRVADLAAELEALRQGLLPKGVNRWVAALAVAIGTVGGFILGRGLP